MNGYNPPAPPPPVAPARPKVPFKYRSMFPTGSRYVVDPPVMDTDDDWLVLVDNLIDDVLVPMSESEEWVPCLGKSDPYRIEQGMWRYAAYRNGAVNIIVTDDVSMYLRSAGATLLAKELNLKEKDDRIALFRCVRFDMEYGGPLP